MSVNYVTLASEIATAIGHPGNVTTRVTGFAHGILEELTQNGTATVGAPTGNTISGMTGSSMATKVANYAGYSYVSTQLNKFCKGIVDHIQGSGVVSYTGPTPPAVPIYFLGGTISGLNGTGMASNVVSEVGYPFTSTELLAMCGAIANHINNNAVVTSGVIS